LRPFIEKGLEIVWPPIPLAERRFERVILNVAAVSAKEQPLRLACYFPRNHEHLGLLPAIVHL
jgi:hypothetical protein